MTGRPVARIFACSGEGPPIADERDALDVIASALAEDAEVVVVPVHRLSADFFRLRTRVAGEIVQKFVTYRLRLAVIGDLSDYLAGSSALRAFVAECNRGGQTWFLADQAELDRRLGGG
ncbi:MAG TPA: DUF4180 domain-containing protein [Micromonosporaceae bacterium]